eukprot:4147635-Pleurochrysis_carterae.AAC.1
MSGRATGFACDCELAVGRITTVFFRPYRHVTARRCYGVRRRLPARRAARMALGAAQLLGYGALCALLTPRAFQMKGSRTDCLRPQMCRMQTVYF